MQISLTIRSAIQQKLEEHFPDVRHLIFQAVGGGSINQTCRLTFADHSLFCKINSASKFPHLFQKEANGLNLIRKQEVIKTPGVIDCFEQDNAQVLLLEWIDTGERTEVFWKSFGEQLAAMHQVSNEYFGLEEENYMGSVPQTNQPSADWISFFRDQRLHPLLLKCAHKKLLAPWHQQQFENLYRHLPGIFDSESKPALVHGDLWSGNYMCGPASQPFLIDPAVYFGHPSVDLAMTTLFGGFRSPFYEAYRYHTAFPHNYEEQWEVCNLYPLLIHLYLFGGSYLPQIEQTLSRF